MLYRTIGTPELSELWDGEGEYPFVLCNGVPVVPVEPDLKASFDMMRDQPVLSDWKDWQIEQWVKSIVGAALKGGA